MIAQKIAAHLNTILMYAMLVCVSGNMWSSAENAPSQKLVGLVQIRNEELVIETCLRALACYTDAIVVLDDASDDATVTKIEQLAQELRIEKIIKNERSAWQVAVENDNRQKLLEAGRAVGGTHFILIDADEIFSANNKKDSYLRNKIISLKPGMVLRMPCVNMWGGLRYYRNDAWCNPRQGRWRKTIAFCDDGTCSYIDNTPQYGAPAKVIHGLRVPVNLSNRVDVMEAEPYVLIHFKYANLATVSIKKDWYMCLEFIRAQEKNDNARQNAQKINTVYNKREFECLVPHEKQMIFCTVDSQWFDYDGLDFSCFLKTNIQQYKEIKRWFDLYGKDYFKYLNLYLNGSNHDRKRMREPLAGPSRLSL